MKPDSIFKAISPLDPDPEIIESAARTMKKGGLVAFPTTGLYGLGADAMNKQAVERIYRIKKRDFDKPILVLVKDQSELMRLSREIPESASKMIAAFWPGKLTIILQATSVLPDILTGGTGKIGFRIPRHPVASALVRAFNGPVTGTSANLSGRKGCSSVSELAPSLIDMLDLVLDAGPLKGGAGSTVVDATADPPVVLREGAISKDNLFSVLSCPRGSVVLPPDPPSGLTIIH